MAIDTVKVNVQLVVENPITYQEAKDLRTSLEAYLATEPALTLVMYQITEAPSV